MDAALAEAASAQERQQLLQLEVTDLQRTRNELAARVDELAAEQVREGRKHEFRSSIVDLQPGFKGFRVPSFLKTVHCFGSHDRYPSG